MPSSWKIPGSGPRALGSFQIFRSPKPGFWEKMNGTGCTAKSPKLEFENHLPKALFFGFQPFIFQDDFLEDNKFHANEAIYP